MKGSGKRTSKKKSDPVVYSDEKVARLVYFLLKLIVKAREDEAARELLQNSLRSIEECRRSDADDFRRKDIAYHRIEIADALGDLYKKHKKPENVPIEDLIHFGRYRLCFGIGKSGRAKRIRDLAVPILRRGKGALQTDTSDFPQKKADRVDRRNDEISKLGPSELAAWNIEDALKLDPENPLREISVGRSNLHKLRKQGLYAKLMKALNLDHDLGADMPDFPEETLPSDPQKDFDEFTEADPVRDTLTQDQIDDNYNNIPAWNEVEIIEFILRDVLKFRKASVVKAADLLQLERSWSPD